jgi:lysophospholipase L1-like esterase
MRFLLGLLAMSALFVPAVVASEPSTAAAAGIWPRPTEVSLVGDSLTAANPQVYRDAFAATGARAVALSGVPSRALRYGWQCWSNGKLGIFPAAISSSCKREGLEELRSWAASGTLGQAVVVSLGTNDAGIYSHAQHMEHFAQARQLVGPRALYLVSVYSTNATQNERMKRFNDAARQWCAADSKCAFIDWASSTQAQNRGIYTDSVHLNATGTAQRASFIASQVASMDVDRSPLASTETIGNAVGFTPMAPVRVADSRSNQALSALKTGSPQRLQIDFGVVPAGASAVAVNLTVTATAGSGYLTVYPCGSRPEVSSLNWNEPRATLANGAIVLLDRTGGFCVFSSVDTHLVVDVGGFFASSSTERFNPVAPFRVADSRLGLGGISRLGPGQTVSIAVTGAGSAPHKATAVAVNVTAVSPAAAGYVTMFACDTSRPETSALNFTAGAVRANNALVALGESGRLCLFSSVATDVVVDVVGFFGATGRSFQATSPIRLLDTRTFHQGLSAGHLGAAVGPLVPVDVAVAAVRGIPAGSVAAVVNVAVVHPGAPGYVVVYPAGAARAEVSTLNFAAGEIRSNGAHSGLGSGGLRLMSTAAAHLVVDLVGVWV